MKEIINVGIGQAGLQISQSLIQLYISEHLLTTGGQKRQATVTDLTLRDELSAQRKCEQLHSIFQESSKSHYEFRSLLVDTEPDCINELFKSPFSSVLNPNYVCYGKQSANTYAKGRHYKHAGFDLKQAYQNSLQKIAENCDSLEAFVLNHGLEGGTGSGSAIMLMEQIQDLFPKTIRTNFVVAHEKYSVNRVIAPYNTVFGLTKLNDLSDITIVTSNDALYQVARKNLEIDFATYANINWLITQINSSYTAFNRFNDSTLNCDMQDFKTNLVLYPKINFALPSFAPLVPQQSQFRESQQYSEEELLNQCSKRFCQLAYVYRPRSLDQSCRFRFCSLHLKSWNLSSVILARGDIDPDRLARTGKKIRANCKWVDYLPGCLKCGLSSHRSTKCQENDIESRMKKSVAAYRITSLFSEVFRYYQTQFSILYRRKAFLHWFTKEGMEQLEFEEANTRLSVMQKDYEKISGQQPERTRVQVCSRHYGY